MPTIFVRLDPRKLENPDADIRYVLPDIIAKKSGGLLVDDGYDYVGDPPYLLICLKTNDADKGLLLVLDILEHEEILGSIILPAAVVVVNRDGQNEVVYPKNYQGSFPV